MQLVFHDFHGSNISLLEHQTVAHRSNSFANAITFSNRPLLPLDVFLIEIEENENGWSGHLRIGLTLVNPERQPLLPQYALPDLNVAGMAWIFAITKNRRIVFDGVNGEVQAPIQPFLSSLRPSPFHPTKSVKLPTDIGSRIGVYYRCMENESYGEMHLIINGEDQGPLASRIPLTKGPLYAVIDVYGTTKQVRVIPANIRGTYVPEPKRLQDVCRDLILHNVTKQQLDLLPIPETMIRRFTSFQRLLDSSSRRC